MIKSSKRNLYRHELRKIIRENQCLTPDDVLDVLFGTHSNDYDTDLVVKYIYVENKHSFLNRLNSLWVYPLFLVLAPFRYLFFGKCQVDEDKTFGKILIALVGELR